MGLSSCLARMLLICKIGHHRFYGENNMALMWNGMRATRVPSERHCRAVEKCKVTDKPKSSKDDFPHDVFAICMMICVLNYMLQLLPELRMRAGV